MQAKRRCEPVSAQQANSKKPDFSRLSEHIKMSENTKKFSDVLFFYLKIFPWASSAKVETTSPFFSIKNNVKFPFFASNSLRTYS